jgi:excisionase family DNA binding protein
MHHVECADACPDLGFHDFALSLPDNDKVKTPLTAANQLKRCLEMLASPPEVNGDTFTPPQVAERLGKSRDTVLDWIRSNQLIASNLATPGKRPRWVITKDNLDAFLKNRQPDLMSEKQRRRRETEDVIEFF